MTTINRRAILGGLLGLAGLGVLPKMGSGAPKPPIPSPSAAQEVHRWRVSGESITAMESPRGPWRLQEVMECHGGGKGGRDFVTFTYFKLYEDGTTEPLLPGNRD